jgi:hypothetical protein
MGGFVVDKLSSLMGTEKSLYSQLKVTRTR